MAKEAYYFSHDSNARQDPKVLAMMSVYGPKGYGWYWILVEMMREQDGHTLSLQGKYSFNAIAMQMHSESNEAEQFVHDCINEFELFQSDGQVFWSNSLLRRMAMKEEISQKRKKAAEKRWNKEKESKEDTDDMQVHNDSNANAMQGKESKGKETKVKESKKKYTEYVSMKPSELQKLVDKHNEEAVKEMVHTLDNYKGSKGKQYKDDYRAILSWVEGKIMKEKPHLFKKEEEKKTTKEDEEHDEVARQMGLA